MQNQPRDEWNLTRIFRLLIAVAFVVLAVVSGVTGDVAVSVFAGALAVVAGALAIFQPQIYRWLQRRQR